MTQEHDRMYGCPNCGNEYPMDHLVTTGGICPGCEFDPLNDYIETRTPRFDLQCARCRTGLSLDAETQEEAEHAKGVFENTPCANCGHHQFAVVASL